jgi:hypothetical protein
MVASLATRCWWRCCKVRRPLGVVSHGEGAAGDSERLAEVLLALARDAASGSGATASGGGDSTARGGATSGGRCLAGVSVDMLLVAATQVT